MIELGNRIFCLEEQGTDLGNVPKEPELTYRQIEIARLVAFGLEDKRVAMVLGIEPQTAKNHLRNISARLTLENRVEVAGYIISNGLVDVEKLRRYYVRLRAERNRFSSEKF